MRVLLGAFGDPGHAFPMLALGAELVARGHEVGIETWQKWREPAEAAGMMFSAAPEYQVFPTRERPLKPYEAAVIAAKVTRSFVRDFRPDVAVSDILTPAPALAAELEGVPVATLVPHVMPRPAARVPAVLDRRATPADAAGARAVEADLPGRGDRARAGAARVQRLPRAARVGAVAVDAHGAVAVADDGRDVPAARVPARRGRRGRGWSGR